MTLQRLKRFRWMMILLVLALVAIPMYVAYQAPSDAAPAAPSTGMVCTSNPSSTFTLTATDGYTNMADGNIIYMWGYATGENDFQHPSPVLCVNEGDTVTIVLHNSLPEDVSIIFPGQKNVLANSTPAQPQFDSQGNMTSMAPVATANGGSMTYSFVAEKPGTFYYESGTNPGIQVQMGLFGALIVRPAMGANFAYNLADTQFNPDTEYIMMLSEIDPLLHQAVERGESFDMNNYQARYFLINGRTFPDTIAPNFASWLPTQPYSSLAYLHPHDENQLLPDGVTPNPAYNPLPALARYVGLGLETYPFHPHAFNGRIIARDANPLKGPNGEDLSQELFSVPIGPGQTTDSMFDWKNTEGWDPQGPQIPVQLPDGQNLNYGLFYGSPYLGNMDNLPVGTTDFNVCGEFYHIAHNHALQQITGWGVVLLGQITFTRIDPPLRYLPDGSIGNGC